MFNERGFSLIEALAAIVIGVAVVVGVGGLGERLVHHRFTTDGNSAAMSLAERQMEALLADPVQNPSGTTQCATVDTNNLCAGNHSAISLNATAGNSNPQYSVRWTITDVNGVGTTTWVMPTGTTSAEAKQITVSVTHLTNPQVNASLTSYLRVY